MNITDAVIVLSTLVSISGIWVLVMWLGRNYHIDRFRQCVFDLRAELFDLAANGEISFDHPAYGQLRSAMNGTILVAHRISLSSAWLFFLFTKGKLPPSIKPFSKKWEENTIDLKPEVKSKLNKQLEKMNQLILSHLFVNSPLLVATIVPSAIAWISFKFFMEKILSVLNKPIDSFDTAALTIAEA